MNFIEFKKNFSILMVDDNEDNIYTLHRRLENDGYSNFSIAYNGQQALDIIENKKIDLVLLDVMMPDMSGYNVLSALKEKIVDHRIMVLMISSVDSLDSIIGCIKLGAEDFLPKPFNPQLLKARIGSCVEKLWYLNNENTYREQIEQEKSKYLKFLNAIFPPSIVKEMIENDAVKPKSIPNVAVMFADIVSFSQYTEKNESEYVLNLLESFIKICESAASDLKIEKIKTIGDSFMATAGMIEKVDHPVLACVKWASKVISLVKQSPLKYDIRVGIDIGNIICGILGEREYLFDVWGSCVNKAARIQTLAEPNTIYVSEKAWQEISDKGCTGSYVGIFNLKGIDQPVKIYKVDILSSPPSRAAI